MVPSHSLSQLLRSHARVAQSLVSWRACVRASTCVDSLPMAFPPHSKRRGASTTAKLDADPKEDIVSGGGENPTAATPIPDLTSDTKVEATSTTGGADEEAGIKSFSDLDSDSLPWPRLIRSGGNKAPKPRPVYELSEALRLVKESAKAKFQETVEVHVRLGIDPRRGDQMVRGVASLPHGTGKNVRVAVFAEGEALEQAQKAGADVVGSVDLVNKIKQSGGKLDFDKCIATPSFMPKLGQIARILGPRGLMPNPKVGTVTNNVAEAVRLAKQGRVDFKADKSGNVHAGVGKVHFSDEALKANISAFAAALLNSKPLGLKKSSKFVGYFNGVSISSTMGPGFAVSVLSVANAAEAYSKSS